MDKAEVINKIIKALNNEFELINNGNIENPVFIHKTSQIPFKFVQGGEFIMGFSEMEERYAREICFELPLNIEEMRPLQSRKVGALLVSLTPILNKQINHLTEYSNYPAFFTLDNAIELAATLGCRLPKEYEWEYLYRAGTQTLFPFGNQLPSEDLLEKWLSSNFENLNILQANSFGLYGMTNPEWCDDIFTINLNNNAEPLDGSYVIRGGGAYFWPWQDEEWAWCVSAMRSPSSSLEDNQACLRLVKDVGF